jgi:hypothetical protein
MQFSQRLINLEAITIFTVATFFLALFASMAFYLRAHYYEIL